MEFWKTPEGSVLFDALEVRILTHQHLLKMERFQMKCLRHITRQPAHIDWISSNEVREQCDARTIVSVLRARRLKWSQRVLRPVFRGVEHGYDASLAVRAVVGGDTEDGDRHPDRAGFCEEELVDHRHHNFEGNDEHVRYCRPSPR